MQTSITILTSVVDVLHIVFSQGPVTRFFFTKAYHYKNTNLMGKTLRISFKDIKSLKFQQHSEVLK